MTTAAYGTTFSHDGRWCNFRGSLAAAELVRLATDKSVVERCVIELIAQRGLRLPTEFALDFLSRAGRVKVGDARLEDPRWRRPRLDHQLFESFLFSLVEAAVVVELEMAEVGALHSQRATAVEVDIDLGVLDALRFELGIRLALARLEDAKKFPFRQATERAVIMDDEVAGPDAHIAILRGPRHSRGRRRGACPR